MHEGAAFLAGIFKDARVQTHFPEISRICVGVMYRSSRSKEGETCNRPNRDKGGFDASVDASEDNGRSTCALRGLHDACVADPFSTPFTEAPKKIPDRDAITPSELKEMRAWECRSWGFRRLVCRAAVVDIVFIEPIVGDNLLNLPSRERSHKLQSYCSRVS